MEKEMRTEVERVAVTKGKLIRSRPLLGCGISSFASLMSVAPGFKCCNAVGVFIQVSCSILTAESLWHLPKMNNKHDADPSRMLVDLGPRQMHDQF